MVSTRRSQAEKVKKVLPTHKIKNDNGGGKKILKPSGIVTKKNSGSSETSKKFPKLPVSDERSSSKATGEARFVKTEGSSKVSSAGSSKTKQDSRSSSSTSSEKDSSKVAVKKVSNPAKHSTKKDKSQRISTRAATRQNGDRRELYTGIEAAVIQKPRPKPKKPKSSEDETVIEVKLLTGTLYIIRGSRPRAEFVRVV